MSIDLTTHYGYLKLRSPVVVGACPLAMDKQSRIAFVSAGAGAIVLPSLFEEQVERWNPQGKPALTETSNAKHAAKFAIEPAFKDADQYLETLNAASNESSVPVMASLCGRTAGRWLDFAAQLEKAGAAAIELNVYPPHPSEYECPREVEDALVDFVTTIDAVVSIPLYLKLHRQFTSVGHLARKLLSGVEGLTLFARQPTVDIRLDEPGLKTEWGLTAPGSISDSLRAIMQIHEFCPAMSLAATGGISDSTDLIKALLAGADVGMIVSAIYRDSPDVIRSMLDGLTQYMESHRLQSLHEMKATRSSCFGESDQTDYVHAVSTEPTPTEIAQTGNHALHADRWGHVVD